MQIQIDPNIPSNVPDGGIAGFSILHSDRA